MTFEELKAEADRQGYRLIKKQNYISLNRCPLCGKKPKLWHSGSLRKKMYICECAWSKNTDWCSSEREARDAWNKLTEEEDDKIYRTD